MLVPSHLVIPNSLAVASLEFTGERVLVHAKVTNTTARCPTCQAPSDRVHSHYTRTLADLPWAGLPVSFKVVVRRFRCPEPDCSQSIFAERLGEVAQVYARRTSRQQEILLAIAYAVGGEAGARLAWALACGVSADTLLRAIRRAPECLLDPPTILGVDDWAWRKGHRYGTILVDLARRRVIDLLPERSAASFAAWLREYSGIQVISRDRGNDYIHGASTGAPDAVQVADRFHLFMNLSDAVEGVFRRLSTLIQQVPAPGAAQWPAPLRNDREVRRSRVRATAAQRYETIQAMHAKGMSQRAIARELGLNRNTVRRYVRAETVPVRARRASRKGILAPYEAYLRQRWREGERNGMALWREIVAQGYPGASNNVSRLMTQLRKQEQSGEVDVEPVRGLTPRQALGPLLVPPERRTVQHEVTIRQLKALDPQIEQSATLLERFARILRARDREDLEPWLQAAKRSGVAELVEFAKRLRQDRAAVEAACTLEWSQGQVEGQITKLKLIRRQMYGRGNFDLVRKRVLYAA
jgi:transposase